MEKPKLSKYQNAIVKKRYYYAFAIIAAIFLQFQIPRLWFRRHLRFSPEQLKLRQLAVIGPEELKLRKLELEKKKLAFRPPQNGGASAIKPTPENADSFNLPVKIKHPPIPTPPPAFTYVSHQGQSRLFAYMVRAKTRIKVDLFYDIYPESVIQFISEVLGCIELPQGQRGTVKLNLKWLGGSKPDGASNGYIGFLFKDDLKNKNRDLILINNPTWDMTKNLNLIGGVLSYGYLRESSGEEIIYNKSDVLFTYIENEETNKQYELFKRVVDQIKSGCKK